MKVFEDWLAKVGVTSHISSTTLDLVFRKEADNYSMASPLNFGAEDYYDYLKMAYELEGGLGDNKGAHRGIFQFSKIAWHDVGRTRWEEGTSDIVTSTRAMLDYFLLNHSRYVSEGFDPAEFSSEIGYLYHNQGPGAAKHYLRTGTLKFPKQSNAALKVFESIRLA